MTNLGVKALLSWVNSIKLSDSEIRIGDLQDGAILVRLISVLKKKPNPSLSNSSEDWVDFVAEFLEGECRFNPTKGTCISWDGIRGGHNLTVEISKVLVLLVYHDMMNERCTLNALDCEVERELANLTLSYVMESEGCVYLNKRLDSYLTKRYLPVSREIFDQTATTSTSTSNLSTSTSLSDDESPVFLRTQKVTFVDLETVASSSVSKSPLAEVMNTPKFQMRKMRRQMMKEREYRDSLEKELSNTLALITQKESQISQLQYHLDKLKEQQGDQEQTITEQISELEAKNNSLQMRLNELLKENKDLKNTSLHMERKVDELAGENGALSFQMRAVCSKLAIFEAENGQLTRAQASAEEEWRHQTSHLQSELNQATTQKELLCEQIQILQGKISCLEEELSKAAKEEVGENMGPVMEREMLETEINSLKNELESTLHSLRRAEEQIQTTTHRLAECEKEITQHKEHLEQQKIQTEEMIQAKDEILDKLRRDLDEQRLVLEQEISDLKLQLEHVEHQKAEQVTKLQQHIAACEQEIITLKDIKRENEDLLHQTNVKVKDLEAKLVAATTLLADKEQQINCLKGEVCLLAEESKTSKDEIQSKQDTLDKLLMEKAKAEEILHNKIQTLTVCMEDLSSSLKRAEQEIQLKQDLLTKTQHENAEERNVLQQQILSCQGEMQRLKAEILDKNEQVLVLENVSTQHSESLQQEINNLKVQIETLSDALRKAEEQTLTQQGLLTKLQQENCYQTELLQQQLSASEEEVKNLKQSIQTKEYQMQLMKTDCAEQVNSLHQEIQNLKTQVECLSSSLKAAEENLQSRENQFREQQQQSTQQIETLQMQMDDSQDEIKKLKAQIGDKEEQLVQLKTETSTKSELLQQEIEALNEQMKSISNSLEIAENQVKAREDLLAKQEQESVLQIEELRKNRTVLEQEVNQLIQDVKSKEDQVQTLKADHCKESEALCNEMQTLKNQVQCLNESLKSSTEQVLAKENLLAQKEMEISQQKDSFQNMRTASEEETTRLREAIKAKEDQLISLKEEGSTQSDMLQHEIKSLQAQLCDMAKTMKTTEEKLQAQIEMLSKQEQDIYHQKELLQEQLSASEEEMRMMRSEIQSKEKQMELLKTENAEQLYLLHQETKSLNKQMETLSSSLRKAEDEIHSREDLLAVQRQENTEQSRELHSLQENVRQLKKQLEQRHSHEEDIERLKKSQAEKENELLEAENKLQALQTELSEARMLICDKDQNLNTLREEVVLQVNLLQKAKGEAEATEKIMAEIREENSRQKIVLQNEIQGLKGELETISQSLCAKEQKLLETQQASVEQVNNFQQQLLLVKGELDQQKEALDGSLRSKDAFQDLQLTTLKEKEALYQEKEVLMSNIIQAEGDQKALEKQVKVVILEKDRLAQANQALERENVASRRLEAVLQRELEILKMEKEQLLRRREEAEESELIKGELKQQLAAKTEAVEHYKAQMEKAVSHYNSKKQLLQKSEEDNMELKQALEVKDNEFKTILMENKVLQLGLERIQANEKKLKGQVASLEAQLAYADQVLRAQNKIHGNGGGATESAYLGLPRIHLGDGTTTQVKTSMSSDSLDQSSLEDSLNTTRKLSAPGESSTPLVRSSERLAAKRQGLQAESLETLYFTPINTRRTKRTSDDSDMDLNSTRKNPTSSVKRRRTTQVINITMSKKTPGCSEADETFYSLQSARSHPNLAGAHVSRPMSMEVFNTPAGKTAAASDQLIGLPGYRQSTAHSQTASTFCVGAENEPDGGPEDWLRIAELQARNKTCLPHLKSSYPVESETGHGRALIFTDEELRTGDPSDTIRRASMMPGQLQDSLVSHRHSLMMGHTGVGAHSHRLSLMPGQLPARPALSSQMKCPKSSKQSSSTFSIHQTSPEKKTRASCFPRPITPKNKNMSSGPSSTRLQAVLSPAERRQSMMFTIENTPKSNGYLKKGLNKLRNSARKTPLNSRATVGRSAKAGSLKSPQVAGKGQRGSQASRSAKSPGLTASARKVMRRMKI